MSTTAIPNVGLSIDMQDYSKMRAFIGGADFWNANYQAVLRDIFSPLLPEMDYDPTENTVTASYIENSRELISTSVPLVGGGEKGRKITPRLIEEFKQVIIRAKRELEDPKINPDTKAILKAFSLPLPTVAPELYRFVGRGNNTRLFIMWGMEKSPETSVLLTDIDPDNFFPMYTVGKSLDLKTGSMAAITLLALSGLALYTCKDKEVEIVEKTVEKTSGEEVGLGISWLEEDKDCEEDVEDIIVRKISAKSFDADKLKVVYYQTGKTRIIEGEIQEAETREGEFYVVVNKIPTGTMRYEITIVKAVEITPNEKGETLLTDTNKDGKTIPVTDQNSEPIILTPLKKGEEALTTDGKVLVGPKGVPVIYDGTKLISDGEEIIVVNGKLQTVNGEPITTAPAPQKEPTATTSTDNGTKPTTPVAKPVDPVKANEPLTYTGENGQKETVKLNEKEVTLAPVSEEELKQNNGKVPAKTKNGEVLTSTSGAPIYYDGTRLIEEDGGVIEVVNGLPQTSKGEQIIAEQPSDSAAKPGAESPAISATTPDTEPVTTPDTAPAVKPTQQEIADAPKATVKQQADGTGAITGGKGEDVNINRQDGTPAKLNTPQEGEALTDTEGHKIVTDKGIEVIYQNDNLYIKGEDEPLSVINGKVYDKDGQKQDLRPATQEQITELRQTAQKETNERIIEGLKINSEAMPFSVTLVGNATEQDGKLTLTLKVTAGSADVTGITIGDSQTTETTISIGRGEKVYIGAKQGDKTYGANYTFNR